VDSIYFTKKITTPALSVKTAGSRHKPTPDGQMWLFSRNLGGKCGSSEKYPISKQEKPLKFQCSKGKKFFQGVGKTSD